MTIIKGYKSTDKYMKCRGFQFELGKWYEHDGDIALCKSGFHFCKYPSGVYSYYSDDDSRVFEIEAEGVLEAPEEPGADYKLVCKRIRLVKEITPGGENNTGDYNTGYRNTGNRNTGDRNTGNRNTGDSNTGDSNTGDYNTGDRNTGGYNTGNRNTGYSNTGNRNTGYRNTGDYNTGDSNTGDSNTGDYNTGDRNTGYSNTGDSNIGDLNTGIGNACNRSSGMFCVNEPTVVCFDVDTHLSMAEFMSKYPEHLYLSYDLLCDDAIDFEKYKNLPGITEEKLKILHGKFIAVRRNKKC